MKLNKVILAGAALVAAVSFIGCGNSENDEHGIIKGTYNIDYTNDEIPEGKDKPVIVRGWKTTSTKHEAGTAVITLNPASGTDKADGNIGYMWNMQEAEDGTYSFCVATFRYNPAVGTGKSPLQTYVSYYEGVDPKNLDDGDNFKDINGKVIGTNASVGKETKIIPSGSASWVGLTNPDQYKVDGEYKIAVSTVMNIPEGKEKGSTYDANDVVYTVAYTPYTEYEANRKNFKNWIKNKTVSNDENETVENGVIEKASVVRTFNASAINMNGTGHEVGEQFKLGCYAAVQPNKTLKASMKLMDVQGEPIVEEE